MFKTAIQIALPTDADEISNLILQNASFFLKQYYSDQQWIVFLNYYSPTVVLQNIQNQYVFCAKYDGKIVGTIALDKNYVVGFYTHVDFVKHGIGCSLLEHLENFAKKLMYREIILASSPIGKEFYIKYGWEIDEETTVYYQGVGFEETIMKKQI